MSLTTDTKITLGVGAILLPLMGYIAVTVNQNQIQIAVISSQIKSIQAVEAARDKTSYTNESAIKDFAMRDLNIRQNAMEIKRVETRVERLYNLETDRHKEGDKH